MAACPRMATLSGEIAIAAIADHRMASRLRDVQHRQAVDGDAQRMEIIGHQPRHLAQRLEGGRLVVPIEHTEASRRRIGWP